jgi:hypothetical protein
MGLVIPHRRQRRRAGQQRGRVGVRDGAARDVRRCPAGVTASDSAAAARSVTWVTSTPAAYAALITSTCFVAAASVTYGSMTAPGFFRQADGPANPLDPDLAWQVDAATTSSPSLCSCAEPHDHGEPLPRQRFQARTHHACTREPGRTSSPPALPQVQTGVRIPRDDGLAAGPHRRTGRLPRQSPDHRNRTVTRVAAT